MLGVKKVIRAPTVNSGSGNKKKEETRRKLHLGFAGVDETSSRVTRVTENDSRHALVLQFSQILPIQNPVELTSGPCDPTTPSLGTFVVVISLIAVQNYGINLNLLNHKGLKAIYCMVAGIASLKHHERRSKV